MRICRKAGKTQMPKTLYLCTGAYLGSRKGGRPKGGGQRGEAQGEAKGGGQRRETKGGGQRGAKPSHRVVYHLAQQVM